MKKAIEKKLKRQIQQALTREMAKNDRLLAKILVNAELTPTEQERWQRLQFIIDLRLAGYSKQTIAIMIGQKYGVDHTNSYRMIAEATELFGQRQPHLNKKAEAELLAEQLMQLYDKAVKSGDLKTAKDCLTERGKVLDLYNPNKDLPPPSMPVIQLSFNVNPSEQTFDADYEPITENEQREIEG